MKYIIIASLFSSAALAAPLAQQSQANTNAGATQAGAGTVGTQAGAGQVATGQAPQRGTQGQGQTATQQAGTGTTGLGANNINQQNSPQQGAAAVNGQTPSANDLATAVSNWMADTSMVSNFLNTGASIQNNVAFKQAATVAFNAEVDELNHKAIIDAANGQLPNVQAANSTLVTGGAFQDVVDKLQEMSVKGRAAVANIDLINQNRCVNVLPNIDAYMASTGSSSQAVRPQVCDQTGVVGGVQGNGPTQPGGTPGTPQAAFAAAQALASGQGNGIVQNGAPTAGTAQGQTPTQGQAGAVQGQIPAQGQTPTQGQAGAQGQQAGATQGQIPTQGQQAGAAQGQIPTQGQTGAQGQQAGTSQGQIPAQGQAGAQGQQAGATQGQIPAQGQAGAQGQQAGATQSQAPAQGQAGQQAGVAQGQIPAQGQGQAGVKGQQAGAAQSQAPTQSQVGQQSSAAGAA